MLANEYMSYVCTNFWILGLYCKMFYKELFVLESALLSHFVRLDLAITLGTLLRYRLILSMLLEFVMKRPFWKR